MTQTQPPETPSIAPQVTIFVALAATIAAGIFHYLSTPILAIGVTVAGTLARPPIFTGPKGANGSPTPGNSAEKRKQQRYETLSSLKRFNPLPPLSFPPTTTHVVWLGVGLIAATLPYEGMYPVLAAIQAEAIYPFLPVINGWAAFNTGLVVTGARYQKYAHIRPYPSVTVFDVIEGVRTGHPLILTSMVVIPALGCGAIAGWMVYTLDWYLIQPAWLVIVAVSLIVAGGISHTLFAKQTLQEWKDFMQAHTQWEQWFQAIPKLQSPPRLVEHKLYGSKRECQQSIFTITDTADIRKEWVTGRPVPQTLQAVIPQTYIAQFLPVVEEGKVSHTKFETLMWQNTPECFPNIQDPNIDTDLLHQWVRLRLLGGLSWAVNHLGLIKHTTQAFTIDTPTPLHADESEYAVWEINVATPDPNIDVEDVLQKTATFIHTGFQTGNDTVPVVAIGSKIILGDPGRATLKDSDGFGKLQAQLFWAQLFQQAKDRIKHQPPVITDYRQCHGVCEIITFTTRPPQLATGWIPQDGVLPECLQGVFPTQDKIVRFFHVPEIGGAGVSDYSQTRFCAVVWENTPEAVPDLSNPDTDPELVQWWFKLHALSYVMQQYGQDFDFTIAHTPEPLHAPVSDVGVWKIPLTSCRPGVDIVANIPAVAQEVASALQPIPVYPAHDGFIVGDIYQATLLDPSLVDMVEQEAEAARWSAQWEQIIGLSPQPPQYYAQLSYEKQLTANVTIHCDMFQAAAGLASEAYFEKMAPFTKIVSGIADAKWASVGYYPVGDHPHPGGIRLFWTSARKLPKLNELKSVARRPMEDPAAWVFEGVVNEAFVNAGLSLPFVERVQCFTTPSSSGQIWAAKIQLRGKDQLDTVRKKQNVFENFLQTPWVRITHAPGGCMVYAGQNPTSDGVKFLDKSFELEAVRLDWGLAFTQAGLVTPDGAVPYLVEKQGLAKNPLVTDYTFQLPPGLQLGSFRSRVEKLSVATGNAYFSAFQAGSAQQVVVRAAKHSPLPLQAGFDWDEIYDSHALPFGVNVTGEPVVFDPKLDPHLMVLGMSGSGKSATLQALLTGVAIRGWDLWVFDPTKGAADFQYLKPYAKCFATQVGTAAEGLRLAYAEMERRRDLNQKYGVGSFLDLPEDVRPNRMVVVFDELTSATSVTETTKPSDGASEEEMLAYEEAKFLNTQRLQIGAILGRLAREARSAGVTVIAASQALNAKESDKVPGLSDVKKQAARLLVGDADPGARMGAFGGDLSGIPKISAGAGKGRCVFKDSSGAGQEVQTWYDLPDHVGSMTAHIQQVRQPETGQTWDDTQLASRVSEPTVFGEVIDGGTDFGDIDLSDIDLSDLEDMDETGSAGDTDDSDSAGVTSGLEDDTNTHISDSTEDSWGTEDGDDSGESWGTEDPEPFKKDPDRDGENTPSPVVSDKHYSHSDTGDCEPTPDLHTVNTSDIFPTVGAGTGKNPQLTTGVSGDQAGFVYGMGQLQTESVNNQNQSNASSDTPDPPEGDNGLANKVGTNDNSVHDPAPSHRDDWDVPPVEKPQKSLDWDI